MQIRAVVADDIERVVAFWRDVFPEYNDPSRPQRDPRTHIVRKLAFGDGLFWLAEEDATVIGTVMAGYDGHRGWLYSLGVDRARRDHGIGRTLLAHAEAALKALGCPKVNVQVLDSNAGAREFWQAAGYAPDPVVSLGRRLR
ncbi:MAG: GNAT family acetyltransferase [Burkholderiaceae bacterium]|nr:GNAT family acetyltransferase [Burkholderiaceae bacterium]